MPYKIKALVTLCLSGVVTVSLSTPALAQEAISPSITKNKAIYSSSLVNIPQETKDLAKVQEAIVVPTEATLELEVSVIQVSPAPEPEPVIVPPVEPEPETEANDNTQQEEVSRSEESRREVRESEQDSRRSASVEEAESPAPAAEPAPAPAPPNAASSSIIQNASQLVGTPYVYGGTTPAGFDCSGFTSYVYAMSGINIPRTSSAQRSAGQVVSAADARPGDIIWSPGHVALYAGDGMMIDSARPGTTVQFRQIWQKDPVFLRF